MKSHILVLGVVVVAFAGAAAQPASAGNPEEIEKCANGIHDAKKVIVKVNGHKFDCHNNVVVSVDPSQRGLGNFSEKNAHFEGNFAHVNSGIANDIVHFYMTVENWADGQNCKMAAPLVKIEVRSKLKKFAKYLPNTYDWKNVAAKIDGNWETAAAAIAAGATRRWHEAYEFKHCKRDW